MPIFYTKTLKCGCIISAINRHKQTNNFILENHNFTYICNECLNFSDEILYDILDDINTSNTIITNENKNGWVQIYSQIKN